MNYDDLVENIVHLYEYLRKFNNNLLSIETLDAKLKEFEKTIKKTEKEVQVFLVNTNIIQLLDFDNKIRQIGKIGIQFSDSVLRNILQIHKNKNIDLSYIFEEFIKGITYFRYQQESKYSIIYHRLYSCGSKGTSENLKCTKTKYSKEHKRKIETCYIERLIFDQLYREINFHFSVKGEEMTQDKTHIERLEITKNIYQTCFPKQDIIVNIQFENRIPTRCNITRLKNNKIISEETYVKTYATNNNTFGLIGKIEYIMITDCYKVINEKRFYKSQFFTRESKWIPINRENHSELYLKTSNEIEYKNTV